MGMALIHIITRISTRVTAISITTIHQVLPDKTPLAPEEPVLLIMCLLLQTPLLLLRKILIRTTTVTTIKTVGTIMVTAIEVVRVDPQEAPEEVGRRAALAATATEGLQVREAAPDGDNFLYEKTFINFNTLFICFFLCTK